jgi:hypothetical protein
MTEDEKGLAEVEDYLGRTFGQHSMAARHLINAYLNCHHDEMKTALAVRGENGVRPINDAVFVADIVTRSVAWWQEECATIAKLSSC